MWHTGQVCILSNVNLFLCFTEESYCARLTHEEYSKQKAAATNEGLRNMIDAILDDTKIPLKEKKLRLKQFQKFHPQICAQYFPDIV